MLVSGVPAILHRGLADLLFASFLQAFKPTQYQFQRCLSILMGCICETVYPKNKNVARVKYGVAIKKMMCYVLFVK
jgi:hypothetical protein